MQARPENVVELNGAHRVSMNAIYWCVSVETSVARVSSGGEMRLVVRGEVKHALAESVFFFMYHTQARPVHACHARLGASSPVRILHPCWIRAQVSWYISIINAASCY